MDILEQFILDNKIYYKSKNGKLYTPDGQFVGVYDRESNYFFDDNVISNIKIETDEIIPDIKKIEEKGQKEEKEEV
jgi:hypothetical protein